MGVNPFLADIDGDEYDEGRPYFHPTVFARLASIIGPSLRTALDVACGTGQSTRALAAVSSVAVGLDSSPGMLESARRRGLARFVRGRAEHLPFRAEAFELISVGLGLHWFDRAAFLGEASRVLRPGGWLLIYDSGFCGRMKENPAFADWVARYRQRFPAPPRDDDDTSPDALERIGFSRVASDEFVHSVTYDLAQLVRYLKTQSNVRIVPARGQAEAMQWLRTTLQPLFVTERATFDYQAGSELFRKAD